MKHLLLTTIAAVVLVGCGPDIFEATWTGDIELIKQLTDSDIDVNVKSDGGSLADDYDTSVEIKDMIRNHRLKMQVI